MGLLENLKDKIFGQKIKTAPMAEPSKPSHLDLNKFEEEAANLQGKSNPPAPEEASGNTLKDILQEKTEKLGEKVLEKGRDFRDKATAFGNVVGDKFEELMKKAEEEAAKEPERKENFFERAHRKGQEYEAKARDSGRTFQDSLRDAKKSMLEDDFFAKAADYVDGKKSKPIIIPSDSPNKTKAKQEKNDPDDLIEDAIIEK
jgi:hypothetical protein